MLTEKLKKLWSNYRLRISSITVLGVILTGTVTGAIAASAASADKEAFHGEIVRLHVIANSDSPEDQSLKLRVRDAVLAAADEKIREANDVLSVKSAIAGELDLLENAARDQIQKEGYPYDVHVEWGVFPFPVKSYGSVTLPAGNYRAVRVVIGSGQGKNWWCVMFPPLCFADETHADMSATSMSKLSSSTRDAITNNKKPKFAIRFKIVDMFTQGGKS